MVDRNQLAFPGYVATSSKNTVQLNNVSVATFNDKDTEDPRSIEGTMTAMTTNDSPPSPPPIVYGELSILGYNGYIPYSERNGRRSKSKFLLCKRSMPNGIQKSEHYIVKQPQATKAIQDKDNYSISYTFSRSQTIIVEYKHDDKTDLFQIGRSSEEPIDFVVMDTAPAGVPADSMHRHSHKHQQPSNMHSLTVSQAAQNNVHARNQVHGDNASSSQNHFDLVEMTRYHRNLTKVEEEMLHRANPSIPFDPRGRLRFGLYGQINAQNHPSPINYPDLSNLPPLIVEHFRRQDPSLFGVQHRLISSGSHYDPQQCFSAARPNRLSSGDSINHQHKLSDGAKHNNHTSSKRSHVAQSTISRFACRIIVDREPPYTARIYAAGFDSSKNIFLGEKATKWENNNSIDGLTTNGILLMHPKRGYFCDNSAKQDDTREENDVLKAEDHELSAGKNDNNNDHDTMNELSKSKSDNDNFATSQHSNTHTVTSSKGQDLESNNDRNNNATVSLPAMECFEYGGVWREVSVDGGIYAIRESRSAVQKGKRIKNETNILQDGTLIDLCGATLLWRSVDGFKSSPTKRTLEEKIDILNASRPQCPVGLNTLVIPRKPIIPGSKDRCNRRSLNQTHSHKDSYHLKSRGHQSQHQLHQDKSSEGGSSQQPYVYLRCGHVQGYHDWGATDKSDQRTCPICLSVGSVAKLSMGLEPSFYVDSGPLTHVFNPCGHMSSEKTVRYWTSIKIPHGTNFFHSICPFCAMPLTTSEPASTRLIFQEDLD